MAEHKSSGDMRATCLNTKCADAMLDPHGNHASGACPSASAAVHERLQEALVTGMKEAGFDGKREPSTASVLGGHYTELQCRALFPKTVPKAVQASIDKFKHHLDNKPDEKNEAEHKDWQIKTQLLEKETTERTDNVGRRVDIHATKED